MVKKEGDVERKWTVYVHIVPSGKRYVGITSQTIQQRWRDGKGYKNLYFNNAINKYGWDNIQHEIVAENLSEDIAKKMEIDLISKYKSNIHKYGYNRTMGGDGTVGVNSWELMDEKTSIEAKRKKSFAMKGKNMTPVICITTQELFNGITEAALKYNTNHSHIVNVCKGKRITCGKLEDGTKLSWRYWDDVKDFWHDEIKRIEYICLIQNDIKHAYKSRYKKIICITTGEVFESLKDATDKYKMKHIFKACIHNTHYAGTLSNGTKLKWMYYDEYITKTSQEIDEFIKNNSKNYRKIMCINTHEIFDSQICASNKYNIQKSSISECCNGKRKYAGKHPETGEKLVWMYYENNT